MSALHSSYDLFFLNPVTGTQIVLPSHSAVTKFFKIKAVASSVPSETRLKPRRCYVSCLVFKQKCSLAFCAPGDESWTSIAAEWDDIAVGFRDVEIVDGKLHAVGVRALEFLMVFDIQLDTNGFGNHTCTAQMLVTLHPNIDSILDNRVHIDQHCYLAKGSESKELFMILPRHEFYRTIGFSSVKLEYNVTGHNWVEIVNIGDQVLFIGALNTKFISLGSTTSHDKTLERNSIYFVVNSSKTWEAGVFSLTDKSIKPLIVLKDHLREGIDRTVWFTPNSL
ncbi:PREDICTED: uncharacterized protein LOC101309661 [Fragaria vesca subsp. vesca]